LNHSSVANTRESGPYRKLVVYIVDPSECIPCRRLLEFFERIGYAKEKIEIRDARDHKKEVLWLTGGRAVVPVIVEPVSGRLMIGCPVDYEEFVRELERVIGL